MRPTASASALGVIAILFFTITATASEAESGAIEHDINHPRVDEEDRPYREDERTANETTEDIHRNPSLLFKNDTANEITMFKESFYLANRQDVVNESRIIDTDFNDLQRDQSDVPMQTSLNDSSGIRNSPTESNERTSELIGPKVTTLADESTSLTSKPEYFTKYLIQTSTSVPRTADFARVDSTNLHVAEDGLVKHDKDFHGTTIVAIHETIVSKTKHVEQKNVDDIRAISFQVPPPRMEDTEEQEVHRQRGGLERNDETGRRHGDTRKDNSRPVNNLLLGSGKNTKVFYEIKPSIKTEMEKIHDRQITGSTLKPLTARKFILPSVDSALGKYGPYFVDGDQEMNITARIGSTVLLDCKIGMLQDKKFKVTWLQHSKDSFRLLTVDTTPYSVDQRFSLNFRYPSNWRLQILYATPRDSGLYKCQVATHPPLVKKINVIITAPELTITDDSGPVVSKERHLKAGSALKLRCEARDILESLEESVVWTRGDETLTEDVSENRTTEISGGKEVLVIVSTLIIERASPRHAGNYSCVVPGKAKTTIAVHVLNGELPAAVHDGNGVSRAFLNLWLIHLTMSYILSR